MNYLTRRFPVIGSAVTTSFTTHIFLCMSIPPDNSLVSQMQLARGHCPSTGNAFRKVSLRSSQTPSEISSLLSDAVQLATLVRWRTLSMHGTRPATVPPGKDRGQVRQSQCEQPAMTLKMNGLFAIWNQDLLEQRVFAVGGEVSVFAWYN
ncbi:hypothetical protein AVEN_257376-1 [Araneus ventricosus]|uniref:Uncharacterized protein n=1 Tax=Araneus ventricosus TaxID=182803 RepID=A0A4Y2C9M7_ARAVE|nr:hypothetical protein AVEN_257376-1 [Araneus ventricosus]